MGLLRPSFVPPAEIRALRDLTRTRVQLVRDRTREWQRLEKLLEGALIKLSSAVSRLARAKTARHILEAPADGQRDPETLAAMAAGQIKGGRAAVGQALDGMLPGDHHPRLIRIHLDPSRSWTGPSPRSRTRSTPPWTRSPPPGASAPTASRPPTPARAPRR